MRDGLTLLGLAVRPDHKQLACRGTLTGHPDTEDELREDDAIRVLLVLKHGVLV